MRKLLVNNIKHLNIIFISLRFLINVIFQNKLLSELIFIALKRYGLQFIMFIFAIVVSFAFNLSMTDVSNINENTEIFSPLQIKNYRQSEMIQTDIPYASPLGGIGRTNFIITASYHDPEYYKYFGEWHTGLDIIPSNNYYTTNYAYKITKRVIIFATCNGTAYGATDLYGANYIYLICNDNRFHLLFVHNKVNFINKATSVFTGEPLAEMGSTGKATGAHIHYEIRRYSSTRNYITLDPILFINN